LTKHSADCHFETGEMPESILIQTTRSRSQKTFWCKFTYSLL